MPSCHSVLLAPVYNNVACDNIPTCLSRVGFLLLSGVITFSVSERKNGHERWFERGSLNGLCSHDSHVYNINSERD